MKISLIAAIGKNNELGANNELLWHIPEDFQWFKSKTMGKTMVMGRNTMLSLKKPLKNRDNWVLTSKPTDIIEGFVGFSSWESVFQRAKELNLVELMIIGGANIYDQAMVFADELIITHVDAEFPEADVFFPGINAERWETEFKSGSLSHLNLNFEFRVYNKLTN